MTGPIRRQAGSTSDTACMQLGPLRRKASFYITGKPCSAAPGQKTTLSQPAQLPPLPPCTQWAAVSMDVGVTSVALHPVCSQPIARLCRSSKEGMYTELLQLFVQQGACRTMHPPLCGPRQCLAVGVELATTSQVTLSIMVAPKRGAAPVAIQTPRVISPALRATATISWVSAA